MQMPETDGAGTGRANLETSEPVLLDIRPIFAQGSSPCAHIDRAVASLKPGQDLVLVAPFEPVPLYTKLGAQGFDYESEARPDGSWRIRFVRAGEPSESQPHTTACCC